MPELKALFPTYHWPASEAEVSEVDGEVVKSVPFVRLSITAARQLLLTIS